MATLVTKTIVCDGKHATPVSEGLVKVQLSVDSHKSVKVYCQRHAAPYLKLMVEMGAVEPEKRGRVYTPEEVAARKRATPKRR